MRKLFAISAILTLSIASLGFIPSNVKALSGSQFQAGRIIDDTVFYDSNSMNASQVQSFLNAKVPACDTNGTKAYGNTTRKAYAASKGVSTPFICLKDFKMNTPTKSGESGLCSDISAKSNRTGAQIIDDVARSCGVSQKSLIVLLQKEQSLITDDWPWPIQYRSATGFGCPDTDVCDSQYYGFFNQVYAAARQFKRYRADPTYYNHRAGGNNNVRYHPNVSCGSKTVYIQNQATAGLYNYTPYTPNSAALNNLYGTGNSCSAYGNRNFWRMFNDWFGNPTGPGYASSAVSGQVYTSNSYNTLMPYANSEFYLRPSQSSYVRVVVKNTGRNTWYKTNTRLGTANNYDRASVFSNDTWISNGRATTMEETTVEPGENATFNFKITAPSQAGIYTESFQVVVEGVSWIKTFSPTFVFNVVVPLTNDELNNSSTLSSTQSLTKGTSISSPEKNTILIFQRNGNLELYKNHTMSWQSNTAGRGNIFVNQADGNLVIYDKNGAAVWSSNTFNAGNSSLIVQGDGNVVLYSQADGAIWSTRSAGPDQRNVLDIKMVGVTKLFKGQRIYSPDKARVFVFQSDGNLVLYSRSKAVWSSRTSGKDSDVLYLQSDGNLVIYSTTGRALWSSRTYGSGQSRLVLQQDGNLVLYSNKKATWQSGTRSK